MKRFKPEEKQFILDHYLSLPLRQIDILLGRSFGVTRNAIINRGLSLPQKTAYRNKCFKVFQKGHVLKNEPHNKRKSTEIKQWSKKGKPILMILTPDRKIPLQRFIWEREFGPIPKGYNIIFKDRNPLNCNLDNLDLVSNSELMIRNSALRFGPELFRIIQLRGALNRQINKKLKLIK
jgi:hypothetical protein